MEFTMALKEQTLRPHEILIINSSAGDSIVDVCL
jgi:hypothetical protein